MPADPIDTEWLRVVEKLVDRAVRQWPPLPPVPAPSVAQIRADLERAVELYDERERRRVARGPYTVLVETGKGAELLRRCRAHGWDEHDIVVQETPVALPGQGYILPPPSVAAGATPWGLSW